jgi:ribonucleoside-diphosphate reductase alpha subunit
MNSQNKKMPQTMNVVKRDGTKEEVSFGKCQNRINKLCSFKPELPNVNAVELSQQLIIQISDGIETSKLDELAANICANKETVHPDYGKLASRIIISNHHKNTSPSFSEVVQTLWDFRDVNDKHTPLVAKYFYDLVMKNKEKINSVIDYQKDFNLTYFGFKTLERAYLMRINGKVVERPQQMFMRVALSIHRDDIREAVKVYKSMSDGNFTHATPTLFNMGTNREQASSCFLLSMNDDSIQGIYKTLSDCALISKNAGGIGISAHNVRAKGSLIRGTNGIGNGLVPMLKVFNETARYVDQGGSKRRGSFAIYLEPWHADIEDFLMLRRNTGAETERARDLFYALWVPDLFMKRVKADEDWTLMCPDECPGLYDKYGEEFEKLYCKYEAEQRGRKTIKARKLWDIVLDSQIETGTPYIGYKDAVNRKSNQQNLGVIRSSNLCIEIVEYTSPDEIAVCNLASIALSKFVEPVVISEPVKVYSKSSCKYCVLAKKLLKGKGVQYEEVCLDDEAASKEYFDEVNKPVCEDGVCQMPSGSKIKTVPQIYIGDKRIGGYNELLDYLKPSYNFKKLEDITKIVTRNLNKVIDWNYYPVKEAENSNRRHRPIGIGVQGLADVFTMMRMAYDGPEARELNKKIFAHMYLASIESSMEIARKRKKHIQEYRKLLKEQDKKALSEEDMARLEELKTAHFIIEEELKLPSQYAGAYSSFIGSPAYNGKLQYDLWDVEPLAELKERFDKLKDDIKKHGLRNSLCMAMMPTASTSQILGNNECIEPYTSNIYKRRTLAGEFKMVNQHLIRDLIELGMWSPDVKDQIILNNGSIQNIAGIPDNIKALYKIVWEMKQKAIIDMAADRGAYICQTQSMNLFMGQPTHKKLTSMHFYSWEQGLKTGIYYLRTLGAAQAQQFSIDASKIKQQQTARPSSPEECLSCGS